MADSYPSLTPECPQAHWFEREIAEQWGVVPDGHPWLKPIRFHPSYRPGHDAWSRTVGTTDRTGVTDFFRVEGQEVHEVAVGPVHAGVIEPGHFRFQCHGEDVYHLEISLGYQHRGVERALVGGPNKRTIHYMETLAGDTSIGHATAYCQAIEALEPLSDAAAGPGVAWHRAGAGAAGQPHRRPGRAGRRRRLSADDVLLRPAARRFSQRDRRDLRQSLRSWRWCDRAASSFDVDRARSRVDGLAAAAGLARRRRGSHAAVGIDGRCRLASRIRARVSQEVSEALGLVGPGGAGRGVDRDVRRDFPSGIYRFALIPPSTWPTGDVFARAYVRWLEIQRSGQFILEQLEALPAGPIRSEAGPLAPDSTGRVVGRGLARRNLPRGDHRRGRAFAHYKIVDPSFHNWIGLAMALRNQQISDFPLCNKSFNLSYCGHDL